MTAPCGRRQPLYFELIFMFDRIKTLAPQHPEWKTQQPFKAVLEGDHNALAAMPPADLKPLFIASHTGHDARTVPCRRARLAEVGQAS